MKIHLEKSYLNTFFCFPGFPWTTCGKQVHFSATKRTQKHHISFSNLIFYLTLFADEKIKLWLFIPGRHLSVPDKAKAAVSKLRGTCVTLAIIFFSNIAVWCIVIHVYRITAVPKKKIIICCSSCFWSLVGTWGFWRGGSCTFSSFKKLYWKVNLMSLLFLF